MSPIARPSAPRRSSLFALALAVHLSAVSAGAMTTAASAPALSAETAAAGRTPPAEVALVLPFASVGGGEPEWLGAGLAEFVAEGIRGAGYRTVSDDDRRDHLAGLGLDEAPRLPTATACLLARDLGARYLVTGSWAVSAEGTLAVTARAVDARRLVTLAEASSSGPSDSVGPVLATVVTALTGPAGRTPGARRCLESLRAAPGGAISAWLQASAEPEQAAEHLGAALAASPAFAPALIALAEVELAGGQPERVSELLARLPPSAAEHHHASARLLGGRAALALGDVPGALRLLAEAVRLWPDRRALVWLGEAQLESGDLSGAAGSARRALELAPGDDHARDLLGRVERGDGSPA